MAKSQDDFEIDQLYTLIISSDYVQLSDTIRNEIRRVILADLFMSYLDGRTKKYSENEANSLLDSIELKWRSPEGLLPKRINKIYHRLFGIQLSEYTSAAIGNIVRKELLKDQEYHFDFTKNFDWVAGDFADGQSCFWQGRKDIRRSMNADKRFYAIRFFRRNEYEGKLKLITGSGNVYHKRKDAYYTGIARAWLGKETIKYEPVKGVVVEKSMYFIFNGYGMTTPEISTVFTKYLGLSSSKISLTNFRNTAGGLYVNGDGYVVGDPALISKASHYDFGLPNDYDAKSVKNPENKGHFTFDSGLQIALDESSKEVVYRRKAA